jgi:alkyl sulfatase BDS1-like metallo-beta-lactamase superfamily hydrolase
MELRHGVLVHRPVDDLTAADDLQVTLTLDRATLLGIVTQQLDLAAALGDGRLVIDGDAAVVLTLVGLADAVDPSFPIVTP